MSLEVSRLIFLTIMFMIILLARVSVLILLSSGAVIIFMAGIFVCVLMLIWSILMVEYISKVTVDNGFNH